MKTLAVTIRNEFNDKAENLGCNARLGGSGKSPKFFEFRGYYTSDGFEVWVGISIDRFVSLTNKYAELHND
jgi:predicted ribosome quality control (RQC) complex YloA/Tae2 family protein